jgi:hypothetical protein
MYKYHLGSSYQLQMGSIGQAIEQHTLIMANSRITIATFAALTNTSLL